MWKKIDILLCVLKKIDSPYVLVVFVIVTTSKVDVTRGFNWFFTVINLGRCSVEGACLGAVVLFWPSTSKEDRDTPHNTDVNQNR